MHEFTLSEENAEAIADICRRLDGIPLAIELAAARVKLLSVDQIRSRLDDRFRLLTGGSKTALPRHQTLQTAVQWSYDQLSSAEQHLLRVLSVFSGGWTLDTAARVSDHADEFEVLDLLSTLVDKSLVLVDRDQD
ncbi:MAG: AfsR/SARP family transcriptional regulator, partial [Acidobacteria bacterium]|nr:AfsR/SARP family transcriptional regulator [Acidobacteriota bacterium]